MPTIVEDIPTTLKPAANAALAWINEQHGANYKLTGLVDPDPAWQADQGTATTMAMVLCENDMCAREEVRIQRQGDGFQIAAVEALDTLIPPHLDPPKGVRSGWLENQISQRDFTVFIFYRGLW